MDERDWMAECLIESRVLRMNGRIGTTRPKRKKSVKTPNATVLTMKLSPDRQRRPIGPGYKLLAIVISESHIATEDSELTTQECNRKCTYGLAEETELQ
jgi:hypothetical protein